MHRYHFTWIINFILTSTNLFQCCFVRIIIDFSFGLFHSLLLSFINISMYTQTTVSLVKNNVLRHSCLLKSTVNILICIWIMKMVRFRRFWDILLALWTLRKALVTVQYFSSILDLIVLDSNFSKESPKNDLKLLKSTILPKEWKKGEVMFLRFFRTLFKSTGYRLTSLICYHCFCLF